MNVENTYETMIIGTTGDFEIKGKCSGNYLLDGKVHEIFPKDDILHGYIDSIRLRPKTGDSIPGEKTI